MKLSFQGAIAFSAAVGLTAMPAFAQEHVFGVITSPTNPMTKGVEVWLDNVNDNLEGGFEHEVVSGGAVIGKGNEVSGFESGLVDGGMITTLYYPSELPINNKLGDLNLLVSDSRAGAAAVLETVLLHCDSCLGELIDRNIFPMGAYATPPNQLWCTSPVATLEDLKGKRLIAIGTLGKLFNGLGAAPVNIGIGEIYEALQRGQADCTVFTRTGAPDYSINDVAPNMTAVEVGPLFAATNLSLRYDLWEGLSAADRQVFVDAALEGMTEGVYGYFEGDREVADDPGKYGVTVVEPGADLQAGIGSFAENVAEAKIKELEERGIADAAEIVGTFSEMAAKWTEIVAGTDDRESYKAALKREIFDKFPVDK